MTQQKAVSRDEWLKARVALLAAEKELTRKRDELSRRRRELPWVRLEKDYIFEGPEGPERLSSLFGNCSQLMIYHFMLGPGWEAGCKSCSYLADHFDAMQIHLAHRDIKLVVVSRAPLPEIQAFQKRMGWRFHWVSAFGTDFQRDYGVHFTKEELADGAEYNYGTTTFSAEEAPGLSVFMKDQNGAVFHTYSTYARGLDPLIGTYQFLDLAPKGRNEDGLAFSMSWVRHHDDYPVAAAPYEKPSESGNCCMKAEVAS